MKTLSQLEIQRLALQDKCDQARTQKDRNRMGQFATPPALALEMLGFAKHLLPSNTRISFLDPAFGTGSFYSALLQTFHSKRIEKAVGFEIDKHYGDKTRALWNGNRNLELHIHDFTTAAPPKAEDRFDLVICNPPYVRHHHLTRAQKTTLRNLTQTSLGLSLSGLTGLYCYFLLLADSWVREDGVCIWLVPAEFMDVNYGVPLKEYLLTRVTLMQIHRFEPEDVQFTDALVSSAVVCFRKAPPPSNHSVNFSFGGSLSEPKRLEAVPLAGLQAKSKWDGRATVNSVSVDRQLTLSDLFHIKRGLATGDNKFFILPKKRISELQLPMQFFKPILPSPRYLRIDEVESDHEGNPVLEQQLFILDCRLSEEELRSRYPRLWKYLETGKQDVANGYLCKSRSPWYSQENRPAPLFLCTYMGRSNGNSGAPFRFILNKSKATAANVY